MTKTNPTQISNKLVETKNEIVENKPFAKSLEGKEETVNDKLIQIGAIAIRKDVGNVDLKHIGLLIKDIVRIENEATEKRVFEEVYEKLDKIVDDALLIDNISARLTFFIQKLTDFGFWLEQKLEGLK